MIARACLTSDRVLDRVLADEDRSLRMMMMKGTRAEREEKRDQSSGSIGVVEIGDNLPSNWISWDS